MKDLLPQEKFEFEHAEEPALKVSKDLSLKIEKVVKTNVENIRSKLEDYANNIGKNKSDKKSQVTEMKSFLKGIPSKITYAATDILKKVFSSKKDVASAVGSIAPSGKKIEKLLPKAILDQYTGTYFPYSSAWDSVSSNLNDYFITLLKTKIARDLHTKATELMDPQLNKYETLVNKGKFISEKLKDPSIKQKIVDEVLQSLTIKDRSSKEVIGCADKLDTIIAKFCYENKSKIGRWLEEAGKKFTMPATLKTTMEQFKNNQSASSNNAGIGGQTAIQIMNTMPESNPVLATSGKMIIEDEDLD